MFVPDEPVILDGTQELPPMDGNTYRTWGKRWIEYDSTPGEDEGSGGTTFGSCKTGAVKGMNVFFRNRAPLTPTWIHMRLLCWMCLRTKLVFIMFMLMQWR